MREFATFGGHSPTHKVLDLYQCLRSTEVELIFDQEVAPEL